MWSLSLCPLQRTAAGRQPPRHSVLLDRLPSRGPGRKRPPSATVDHGGRAELSRLWAASSDRHVSGDPRRHPLTGDPLPPVQPWQVGMFKLRPGEDPYGTKPTTVRIGGRLFLVTDDEDDIEEIDDES